MNTKNNKRKRESVQKIEQVLVELLQTKELNQIRVSDICKRANLNRSTFYANYVDIYELADTIKEKLEAQVAELWKAEIVQGYNSNNYLVLFQHIAQNQIFYRTYFKLGYDEKYKIFQYDYNLAKKYFDDCFIEYHMEFFKSGLNRIIKLWLQNGCKETPEEIFEIIKSEYQGREEFFATT
ncbi:MAG: TetR/AcrR family transcriptional regulator [Lachnospiraceae bacterium]|nr:TetR/AcrR family transcriptional regulator [Lachnospiraceae bacterium]